MRTFDYRESTLSYDYQSRTVEFYFTKESNYHKCLERNPHCCVAEELNPGYRIVYPFNQCRTPEFLLRVPRSGVSSTTPNASSAAVLSTQEATK